MVVSKYVVSEIYRVILDNLIRGTERLEYSFVEVDARVRRGILKYPNCDASEQASCPSGCGRRLVFLEGQVGPIGQWQGIFQQRPVGAIPRYFLDNCSSVVVNRRLSLIS